MCVCVCVCVSVSVSVCVCVLCVCVCLDRDWECIERKRKGLCVEKYRVRVKIVRGSVCVEIGSV